MDFDDLDLIFKVTRLLKCQNFPQNSLSAPFSCTHGQSWSKRDRLYNWEGPFTVDDMDHIFKVDTDWLRKTCLYHIAYSY